MVLQAICLAVDLTSVIDTTAEHEVPGHTRASRGAKH